MTHLSCISHLTPTLHKSHLVHSDIAPLINALNNDPAVAVKLIGRSFEQRPLHLLTLGQGSIVIFAWTQMHGNEATATAAVFDLIDQLIGNAHPSIQNWACVFTIHIFPMVNPDGAQRCIRQNAQAVDINRDARQQQTPEGQILMGLVDQLSPNIGFNLHDQSPYYQCGNSGNPATIAFLAPAFDEDKTVDAAREQAMLLIAHMNNRVQIDIPNCVARYNDGYCARSFGDNIAAKNVSTILIESGAAKDDDKRQIARKMNVVAIISALEYLMPAAVLAPNVKANKEYKSSPKVTISDYFAIPENVSDTLSSLVIRNLTFAGVHPYMAGLSVKQTARYSNVFIIDFIGDLHNQAGLTEFDAQGLVYQQGKIFTPNTAITFTNESYIALVAKGYLYVHDPLDLITNKSKYDICYTQQALHDENAFILQQGAYCLFADLANSGRIRYAMVNGKLVNIAH